MAAFESVFETPLKIYVNEYQRFALAKTFGWTLEYIDSMPYEEQLILFAIFEGQSRARKLEKTMGR